MLPDREGRFKASIAEHGVDETGPNNLATFVCKFALTEELVGGQWTPLGPDESSLDITGYFYLEKRDGSINTVTVENLKEAFGWDGRDLLWLKNADFANLTVQVKLEYQTYQGKNGSKTNLKVRYVNAEHSSGGGGVPRASDDTIKAMSLRLGSKLRALAGGTPAVTPKPNGKPVAPPAKPKTPVLWRNQLCGLRRSSEGISAFRSSSAPHNVGDTLRGVLLSISPFLSEVRLCSLSFSSTPLCWRVMAQAPCWKNAARF